MGRRSADEIAEAEEKTYQYISGLAKSRRRVQQQDFNYYNVRLTDKRLLTLLLTVCEHRKYHLPEFVEELLISAMRSRDKAWRQYFTDDKIQVEIQDTCALVYRNLECGSDYSAEKLQRMNGGSV